MGKLCICKCERKPLCYPRYGAYEDEAEEIRKSFCSKCGERFKVIPMPIIGVLVKLEGNPSDDCCWITTSEFMELVLKKGKEAGDEAND